MHKLTMFNVYSNGRNITVFLKGTQIDENGKSVVSPDDYNRAVTAVTGGQRGITYSPGLNVWRGLEHR